MLNMRHSVIFEYLTTTSLSITIFQQFQFTPKLLHFLKLYILQVIHKTYLTTKGLKLISN